jgi:hypothetical protein
LADLPEPPYGDEEVEAPRSAAHEQARKINPAYTEGELVRVAWGPNQAAAELIQGMLIEHGVPSVLRRSMGFDVPDFLAGGPRDVLVPASGAEAARALLDTAGVDAPQDLQVERPLRRALTITVAILLAAGATALIAWLALQSGA